MPFLHNACGVHTLAQRAGARMRAGVMGMKCASGRLRPRATAVLKGVVALSVIMLALQARGASAATTVSTFTDREASAVLVSDVRGPQTSIDIVVSETERTSDANVSTFTDGMLIWRLVGAIPIGSPMPSPSSRSPFGYGTLNRDAIHANSPAQGPSPVQQFGSTENIHAVCIK